MAYTMVLATRLPNLGPEYYELVNLCSLYNAGLSDPYLVKKSRLLLKSRAYKLNGWTAVLRLNTNSGVYSLSRSLANPRRPPDPTFLCYARALILIRPNLRYTCDFLNISILGRSWRHQNRNWFSTAIARSRALHTWMRVDTLNLVPRTLLHRLAATLLAQATAYKQNSLSAIYCLLGGARCTRADFAALTVFLFARRHALH